MVMIPCHSMGKAYSMDGWTYDNLSYVKDRVLNHNDMGVFLIDGKPGAGKSTLAAQFANFLTDGKFSLQDECFTSGQTTERLNAMKAGEAIVIDESFEQFNRRKTQSNENMLGISLLQRMRSKRVFIFVLLPFMYDLDKNLILGLANTLFHCYRQPFGDRGQYSVYDEEGIKKLWLYGRQSYSYSEKIVIPNFRARFSSFFPIDYEAYEKKKQESSKELGKETQLKEKGKFVRQRNLLLKELYTSGRPISEISKLTNIQQRQIYNILNDVAET